MSGRNRVMMDMINDGVVVVAGNDFPPGLVEQAAHCGDFLGGGGIRRVLQVAAQQRRRPVEHVLVNLLLVSVRLVLLKWKRKWSGMGGGMSGRRRRRRVVGGVS
jgi:hypothetical protein